uniref:Uncharacterized protein n=1 Tax=Ornithorhynchus anatinus TaxID=9258 RepID=A0A6I8PFA7_ORNAN
ISYHTPRQAIFEAALLLNSPLQQEPWELAALTRILFENLLKIKVPLFDDIKHASLSKLKPVKTVKHEQPPSAQTLAMEREYEQKRLKEIELRNKMAEQIQSLLKGKRGGLRKPLPPVSWPGPWGPRVTQTQRRLRLTFRSAQLMTDEGMTNEGMTSLFT